jgi:hypothetical protein
MYLTFQQWGNVAIDINLIAETSYVQELSQQ